ncbi:hypothetical protein IB286_04800 [Spongiibacter sp. KMU-158]|uniref:Outer membrane protein beta-barrel domain-containing protein n=1 Tax=Spongiibacter pelagi TaxID=2760804 RepID=A0A927GVE9_9GAMM|nr:hypothetical protein [Spongiibacter pelagi]MBD2858320.1 hypothetical protein [Spongiibacter pelagi]
MRHFLILLLLISPTSFAGVNLGVQLSTFGGGLELGWNPSDFWQWRAGNLHGDLKIDFQGENNNGVEGDELSYNSDISLKNFYVFADWHPSGKYFKVSGGLILNSSEANIITRCDASSPFPGAATCEFGYSRFSPTVLGEIHTAIDFAPVAPYLGIGWSKNVERGFNWGIDLGVAYVGEANVSIRSTGSCDQTAECREQIAQEEEEVKNELSDYEWLPLVKLALAYRF